MTFEQALMANKKFNIYLDLRKFLEFYEDKNSLEDDFDTDLMSVYNNFGTTLQKKFRKEILLIIKKLKEEMKKELEIEE